MVFAVPKRSKIDPRGSQKRLFFIFVFDFDFGTILVPFWLPECPPWGVLFGAKIDPQNDQNPSRPRRALRYAPRAPPGAHKTPQEAPKSLSRGAKDAPKTLHEALKRLSRAPPEAQNGVKKEEPLNSIVVKNSIVMHSIDSELKRER